MSKNKEKFTVKVDDKDIELAVIQPSAAQRQRAQLEYSKAFSQAINEGLILECNVESHLRSSNQWDDEKEGKKKQLEDSVLAGKKKLAEGGITLKEGREIALSMRQARLDLQKLMAAQNSAYNSTAESFAENAQFHYLVSVCTVYNDSGKPYFPTLEDYLNGVEDGNEVAIKGALLFSTMRAGLDSDFSDKLPENKFLKKFKFVDDKGRLINKDGHLIDADGHLIDENGRYVNEEEKFVDINGNLVTEDGDYIVDSKPFLDDNGQAIE